MRTSWPSVPGTVAILALGLLLAFAADVGGFDSIVYYVFAIVDGVGADPISLIKPIYNPPPMYTHAYRPLSTALIKLGGWLFGRDPSGLTVLAVVHALFLIPYGLGARHFLRAHGASERVATAAALTAMLTPTVLFSAWTIPEFDMIGGACVLWAAGELRRERFRSALVMMGLALLTKETTAILMLAYLLAYSTWRYREERDLRIWWLPGGYFALLLLAVSPILLMKPPVTHAFNVADAEFRWLNVLYLAFHNASQVLYVLGPAGALLLLHRSAGDSGRWRWPLVIGTGVLFVATPLVRHYNHYESIVFSHWWWTAGWAAVAIVALVRLCLVGGRDGRTLSLAILLGACGLCAGPVLASFSRADLSARLYAPLIPALHGLAWLGAERAWLSRDRVQRWAVVLVASTFAWQPIAGAFSAWQFARARFPVELQAKRALIGMLHPPCPIVFYTNRDQELAIEELDVLGTIDPAVHGCTRLVQLSVTETGPGTLWHYEKRLEGYDQHRESLATEPIELALRERRLLPEQVHLFVQGPRTAMTADASAALSADFEWATKRMPETDLGYFQQTVGVIYVPDTPLERLFTDAAVYRTTKAVPFVQLPIWLNELPRRLLTGVPLLEDYEYRATLYSIPHGVKPRGRPDPMGPHRAAGSTSRP